MTTNFRLTPNSLKCKCTLLMTPLLFLFGTVATSQAAVPLNNFINSYTGLYDGNAKIALFIEKLNERSAQGYSVIYGTRRTFSGLVKKVGEVYLVRANEPGNLRSDGQFVLILNPKQPGTLKGKWTPFVSGISAKSFMLHQQSCALPAKKDLPIGSKRPLTDDELLNLNRYERNMLYAIHGYSFKDRTLASHYSEYDWYMPCFTDVSQRFSTIEKRNIERLLDTERYLEQSGDTSDRR